jgi:hypothetical protein
MRLGPHRDRPRRTSYRAPRHRLRSPTQPANLDRPVKAMPTARSA